MSDLERDLEAAREVTRALHEATKDARALLKEVEQHKKVLLNAVTTRFDEEVTSVVKAGLDRYQESLERHIGLATEAVYKRFDTIRDVLLGESKTARRRGERPIEDMAVLHRALQILGEEG